jgi:hypothetical protein
MSISVTEPREAAAQSVSVGDDALVVDLADGRTITVPLAWFPRLAHGTPPERANWRPSRVARASTGRIWMRISAWRASWPGAGLARRRHLSGGGSRAARQPADPPLKLPACCAAIRWTRCEHSRTGPPHAPRSLSALSRPRRTRWMRTSGQKDDRRGRSTRKLLLSGASDRGGIGIRAHVAPSKIVPKPRAGVAGGSSCRVPTSISPHGDHESHRPRHNQVRERIPRLRPRAAEAAVPDRHSNRAQRKRP